MEAFNFTAASEDCNLYSYDMRKLDFASNVHKVGLRPSLPRPQFRGQCSAGWRLPAQHRVVQYSQCCSEALMLWRTLAALGVILGLGT